MINERLCKEWKLDYKEELWHKLLCFYHARTELYDRSLTRIRSPFDKTEAFITDGKMSRLSNINAGKYRRLIDAVANLYEIPTEIRKYSSDRRNYSAQRYIDEYEWFNKCGDYNWFNKVVEENYDVL